MDRKRMGQSRTIAVSIQHFTGENCEKMTETQSMWAYLPFNPRAKCGSSRLRSSVIYCAVIFGGIMGL